MGAGRAHVRRLIVVARELAARGTTVAFAVAAEDPDVVAEGFTILPVPDIGVTDYSRNLFAAYDGTVTEHHVVAELAVYRQFAPDVVVSDLRPTAALSTRLAGLPHVSLLNAYLSRGFDPALLTDGASVRAGCARVVQRLQKRTSIGGFRIAARRLGLPRPASLDDLLDGDLTLLCDLPDYCPVRQLPPMTSYVGPLVWEPTTGALDVDVPPGRSLIYASTGSTGGRSLADLVVRAFAHDPETHVVLTTDRALSLPAEDTPTTTIRQLIRPGRLLAVAAAAIHSGGNGTTYQVAGAGVPAVVVPDNNDQRINAALIARRGLGVRLEPSRATVESLRSAVERVRASAAVRATTDDFAHRYRTSAAASAVATAVLGMG